MSNCVCGCVAVRCALWAVGCGLWRWLWLWLWLDVSASVVPTDHTAVAYSSVRKLHNAGPVCGGTYWVRDEPDSEHFWMNGTKQLYRPLSIDYGMGCFALDCVVLYVVSLILCLSLSILAVFLPRSLSLLFSSLVFETQSMSKSFHKCSQLFAQPKRTSTITRLLHSMHSSCILLHSVVSKHCRRW